MINLTDEERKCGVLAVSSGNHAQAIALSAKLLGMESKILMPKDCSEMKIRATQEYGGEVILYDRYKDDCGELVKKHQAETGAKMIPPADYFHVIAGAGTVGKEVFEDV